MLTDEQKSVLEEAGTVIVRLRLSQYGGGREAVIGGFKCENVKRGDLEDWLAQKSREEAAQQSSTLLWAKVAAWAGIISVVVTAIGIWLQK